MSARHIAQIFFVRVDAAVGEPIRLCNSLQGEYPVETEWGRYQPAGELLEISDLSNGTDNTAREFTIKLVGTTPEVVRAIMDQRVVDNDVCIHRSVAIERDNQWIWSEPEIVRLGRLGHVVLDASGVTAHCYTAASDMDGVTRASSHWADAQQRKFVCADDYGFRYAGLGWEDVGVITT